LRGVQLALDDLVAHGLVHRRLAGNAHQYTLNRRQPPELAGIITTNLDTIHEHLEAGAIAAFTQDAIRVRPLPLR
jgi:hypothetical protein